jgi:4-hydroxy-tetrahydrodipicolinate reductase
MGQRKRVIFWGPGHIGGATLREVLRRPDEYEVVGARVYSPAKEGRDVGELVGMSPIGVAATSDVDAILALDADCVVFTPLPLDRDQVTADAIALLRSGKNVVTTTTFHYPQLHGADYVHELEDACQAGHVTLHGTGVHPSFMVERLIMTLTGVFTDVRHVRLAEACETSRALSEMAPEFLALIGFGQPLEQITPEGPGAMLVNPYYHGTIAYAANALYGADPQDVRFEHEHFGIAADRDHVFPNVTIAAGTALTLVHVHRGYLGDHHFFTNEEYYYVGADGRTVGDSGPPFGPYRGDANYAIEIKGDPSDLTLQLDLEDTRRDNVPTITYLSVVPLLQSIEHAINAEPGILHPNVAPHWRASRPAVAAAAT